MGRVYSRHSNYAIGQLVRFLVFGCIGAFVAAVLLAKYAGIPVQSTESKAIVVIAGVICGSFAYRYT